MEKKNAPVYIFVASFVLVILGTVSGIAHDYIPDYHMSVLFGRISTALIVIGAGGLVYNFAKNA